MRGEQIPLLKVKRIEKLTPLLLDNVDDNVNFYYCRFCNQKFGYNNKKTIHEGKCSRNQRMRDNILRNRFCCNNCGSNFSEQRTLIHHKTNDCGKIHKCEKCNKVFGTIVGLNRHIRCCQC